MLMAKSAERKINEYNMVKHEAEKQMAYEAEKASIKWESHPFDFKKIK